MGVTRFPNPFGMSLGFVSHTYVSRSASRLGFVSYFYALAASRTQSLRQSPHSRFSKRCISRMIREIDRPLKHFGAPMLRSRR